MSAPDLKRALVLVRQLGIAPLDRIANSRPAKMWGPSYDQWTRRRSEIEREVEANLSAEGARISRDFQGARFAFAGVKSSSTMGLGGALRNWKTAAEKRLSGALR